MSLINGGGGVGLVHDQHGEGTIDYWTRSCPFHKGLGKGVWNEIKNQLSKRLTVGNCQIWASTDEALSIVFNTRAICAKIVFSVFSIHLFFSFHSELFRLTYYGNGCIN